MGQIPEAGNPNDRFRIAQLLDLYGGLLTPGQRKATELYFLEDWSLAEIAEEMEITRQGVRNHLLKAEKTLNDTEEKLNCLKRYENQSETLRKAERIAAQLPESTEKNALLALLADLRQNS